MTADAHLLRIVAVVSATLLVSSALAAPNAACLAAVNAAAQQAVANSPWIGQANAIGAPFVLKPGILRASVGLFGPQSAFFSVDVGVDPACNVRSTSIRLDSNPWLFR